MNEEQRNEMASRRGFIAALDQSGGSTPKALKLYGISDDAYTNDEQMFDLIHQMRERLMASPSFTGDKVLATILFEQTMDRTINGDNTPAFLWKQKHIVPFVKVDQGLSDAANGVQLMKPMTKLDPLLERAVERGIFGTKMRSFIKQGNPVGIKAVVDQQFSIAREILATGLIPIIEPEVDIHSPEKGAAEELLKTNVAEQLAQLREVAADAVLLAGEVVDLALRRGAGALGFGLRLGQQVIRLILGLADDLVRVLLGVADQLLGVLVRVAAGLLGLGARLGRPLLRRGRPLLRLGDELLGRGLGGGQSLGFLPFGFFPARRELDLEFGLGLCALRFALLENPLSLAAHLVGLALGRTEDLVALPLGGRLELGHFTLGRGPELGDVTLHRRALLSDLVVRRRPQLGHLALGRRGPLIRLAP